MAIWTEIGKNLVKEGIFEGFPDLKEGVFERFPELIPAVGEPNYWNGEHKKLLLVGESNYFEDKYESISDFKMPEDWYLGGKDRLIPKEKIDSVNNWKATRGHNNIFKSMKAVLDEAGKKYNTYLLQEAAYYNYFLRPATTKPNKSFQKDCKPIDCQVSYLALCGVIEELDPDIVIFVSKLSYGKFMEYYKNEKERFKSKVICDVNHFSRACWSQPDGQQKFENLLREYWLVDNAKFERIRIIHSELRQKLKVEKDQECFFNMKGSFLSCLYFKVNDISFCCETGVNINDDDFWTCFYKTDNSKAIPGIEDKKYDFTPNISNDIIVVVEEIEKAINQIIKEIEKPS